MAASGNRPFLKRGLEEELGIARKKLKIDEAELLCKNQSDKAGRGRSWKSSYQKYKSGFYGSRKGRNSFKTLIGKKRKEEVDIGDDIEKVDANTIEEIVVWQPTSGSEAFNEGFEVSDLNKIEAFVEEDGDVVEQFWEAMKSVKLLSVKLDSLIMKMRKYQFETMKIFKSMK